MIKFLCEGLTRNAMLRSESKDEIHLQGNDKKCNVEWLKVRMKFLWEGLIKNVM